MSFPPSIARIRIKERSGKGIRLWFPLFLLWPLFFLLWLVYPALILAGLVFWKTPAGRPLFYGIFYFTRLLFSIRGLSVDVKDDEDHVFIRIS